MAILSKKFCPVCKSEDVRMIAGGATGVYKCGDCGFSGALFPEKEVIGAKLDTEKIEQEMEETAEENAEKTPEIGEETDTEENNEEEEK